MSPGLSIYGHLESRRLGEDLENGEGPHVHGVNGNLMHHDTEGVSERSSLLHRDSNVATKNMGLEASFCGPWFTSTTDFIFENEGLLLIVASQLFFAFMNLGVKLLSGLTQPVPTFQVCGICRTICLENLTARYSSIAHCNAHGEPEIIIRFRLSICKNFL